MQVLASDEGRDLRARQQDNVRYIRDMLVESGIPAMHAPSHIIPIHVSVYISSFFHILILAAKRHG